MEQLLLNSQGHGNPILNQSNVDMSESVDQTANGSTTPDEAYIQMRLASKRKENMSKMRPNTIRTRQSNESSVERS